MNAIKRNIPNFITCLNLFCGCIGIVLAFYQEVAGVIAIMFLAALFDFLDGAAARVLKVTSPIGKDLDSLADLITFGLLPGVMMFKLIRISIFELLVGTPHFTYNHPYFLIPFIGFLITVFSAIRLARFNNDATQQFLFKGLPTPASGLFVGGLFYWLLNSSKAPGLINGKNYYNIGGEEPKHSLMVEFFAHPIVLVSVVVILSILLVSNLKLMAFKFKSLSWKYNQWRFILLILCVPLIAWLKFASAPIILILYIIISQIHFRFNKDEIQS